MNATHDIEDAFWFLSVKLSYQRFRSEYSPDHFGNVIVEYRSPGLRVQVTKERGHFLCDFAAAREPVEWFDLDVVLRDLGEDRAADDLFVEKGSSLESVAKCVEQNIDRVREQFNEDAHPEFRARLKAGRLSRAMKLFGEKLADQIVKNETGSGG
jgi:hypothetical protein